MLARTGHRVRWAAVWILLLSWVVSIIFDWAGAFANLLLLLAIVTLLYELLAVDRPA